MFFRSLRLMAFSAIALTLFTANVIATPVSGYGQTNLVSDIPGRAAHTDANLKNPWGISFAPTTPFWVSDNGTGLASLYNGSGSPRSLVVTIPVPVGGMSAPTGQVFNGSSAFSGDVFLFATEDGTIAGWRGALGTSAETLVDDSAGGAVYKGLALAQVASDHYLYAADFHNGRINVIPEAGAPALTGNFTDPTLPAGYAPFNVQSIDGQLYVAFAKQQAGSDDEEAGRGNGYVSVFDFNGNFVRRFASQGSLNAPWGMALAPAGWGPLGGRLLIGNFGDGLINAFDSTGTLVGSVADLHGTNLVNDGLWGLSFGNGGPGFNPNSLYLTAGLNDESNGLFARIDAVPEPATIGLFSGGALLLVLLRRFRLLRS
jgi:uncharacterized protein (TIGR03118 family)